ncbi:MAG: phage baseplate assembly protein [Hyphomicrobiales bacterium]
MMSSTLGQNQVFRAKLQETKDGDGQQLMRVTGRSGEQLGANSLVPRVQSFGLTSNPPAGSHGIVMAPGGDPSAAVLLGVESPGHRVKNVEVGGTALYDQNGNVISLVAANIRIVSPTAIILEAPDIALDGNVYVGGPIGSGVPSSKQGTLDTANNADVGNLATKVFVT